MLLLSLSVLFALVLTAGFTLAELTILPLSESRVRELIEARRAGSAALVRLRSRPERTRILLRFGGVVSGAAVVILSGLLGHSLQGVNGFVIGGASSALLLLLLGDFLPAHIAVRWGDRVAVVVAPPVLALAWVLAPVVFLLAHTGGALAERSGVLGTITEDEIRELTVLGHTVGAIEEHERQLIERAFGLDDTKAWDIMTPRVDIFAWRDSLRLADIAPQLGNVPYSRIPVYDESIDHVTGILYLRDAYQALLAGQRDVPLRVLAREPLIVPGTVLLTKLLRDFQNRRIHLALVLDEYGGTDGVVTLEDVLEELVGEIDDEMDVTAEPITRVSRNEIVAVGEVDLREVNHHFNTSLPQLEHRSLNGYLLEEFGHVPTAGEVLEREGLVIEVLEATETQVVRARLRRSTPVAELFSAAAAGRADAAESVPADAASSEESGSDSDEHSRRSGRAVQSSTSA